MEQAFYPSGGQTINAGLPFRARCLRIQSGQNYITLPDTGETILPFVYDKVVRFSSTKSIARAVVIAPPTGPTPVGPVLQTQTILIWSDIDHAPAAGVSAPAQPYTNQPIVTLTANVAFTWFVGSARACSLGIFNNALAQTSIGIKAGPIGNATVFVVVDTIASQVGKSYVFGQGGVFHMGDEMNIVTTQASNVLHLRFMQ